MLAVPSEPRCALQSEKLTPLTSTFRSDRYLTIFFLGQLSCEFLSYRILTKCVIELAQHLRRSSRGISYQLNLLLGNRFSFYHVATCKTHVEKAIQSNSCGKRWSASRSSYASHCLAQRNASRSRWPSCPTEAPVSALRCKAKDLMVSGLGHCDLAGLETSTSTSSFSCIQLLRPSLKPQVIKLDSLTLLKILRCWRIVQRHAESSAIIENESITTIKKWQP